MGLVGSGGFDFGLTFWGSEFGFGASSAGHCGRADLMLPQDLGPIKDFSERRQLGADKR
jgi:hypothetical protein